MHKGISYRLIASGLCAALVASPALARSASQMSDLVGARGGQAEGQIEARGFVYVDGHHGGDGVHAYWWHPRDKNCINVRTWDGRYASITDAPNRDCNQKESGSTGAAVAGVALGAILIAALAHKSSHHDDGQHMADQAAEQQYDRGYNDGLHNATFHNYERTDAYVSGYQAGVDQRSRNTGYHSGKGGYAAHTAINDLQGMDSIRAIDTMTERGFRDVDSITSGNTQYGIYWKGSTSQCVQVTYADSQVYDIREIGSHPKCRG